MALCHRDLPLLFLLFGCFEFIAGGVHIYITPSPGLSCPEQPCLTLSHFATDTSNGLSSNITLMFLPGSHGLQAELLIVNISELHMLAHSDYLTQTMNILCGQHAKFSFENIDHIYMNHLTFVGCGGNKVESVSQFILEDCSFFGQQNNNGTALELVHTTANIIDSSFIYNTNSSYRGPIGYLQSLRIQEPANRHSIYALVGGALIVTHSNVNITGSIFEGNSAEVGGAIFNEGHSNITIKNSTFMHNHASCPYNLCFAIGGAIYSEDGRYNPVTTASTLRGSMVVANTNFVNNTANAEGGAIVAFYINMDIRKCEMIRNSALSGGALMIQNGNVTIYDSQYDHNIAYHGVGGGAIVANGRSVVNITKSYFSNNTAGQGGVLFIKSLSNATLTDSTFNNNTVLNNGPGGVVGLSIVCELTIMRCHFNNSKAHLGGVVAANIQSMVTILDSKFYTNTASLGGGVISIHENCHLIIVNSKFCENSAMIGSVLTLTQYSEAIVNSSDFYSNYAAAVGGVAYMERASIIQIIGGLFGNNRANVGGVAAAQLCIVIIINSIIFNTTAHFGGVVDTISHCNVIVEGSQFKHCKALESGGVLVVEHYSKLSVRESLFANNTANSGGGVLFVGNDSLASINSSQFYNNKAQRGGVIHLQSHSSAAFHDSDLNENLAQSNGGVASVSAVSELELRMTELNNNTAVFGGAVDVNSHSRTLIQKSSFTGNKGFLGGALLVFYSNFTVISNSLISQNLANIGVLYVTGSNVGLLDNIEFSNNVGSIYVINSNMHSIGNISIEHSAPSDIQEGYSTLHEGGAITMFRTILFFEGTGNFKNNNAESGGALHATDSKMYVNGELTIATNTARYNGGGVYLYRSELKCGDSGTLNLTGNHAFQSGGGICAISSSIEVVFHREVDYQPEPLLWFAGNTAQMGGGIYLEANAKLFVSKRGYQTNRTNNSCCSVVFTNNSADYGGAISVADGTNVGTCNSIIYNTSSMKRANITECFLQVLDVIQFRSFEYILASIHFAHNYALYAGSTLFGGLLDRCTVSPFAEVYAIKNVEMPIEIIYGVSYLMNISNLQLNTVSSYPVRVCFCRKGQPNCNYQPSVKFVKKGENFIVTLVAVDQVSHTVSNTTIHSYLTFAESGLGESQLIQKTGDLCTDLTFSITTTHHYEKLVMYAEGPCKDASLSQKWIDIQFLPCNCPIGFQQKDTRSTKCECECDAELTPYVSSCDEHANTVTKHSSAWISYVNNTGNSSGYLIHPHCPLDYCFSSNSDHGVILNLNQHDGADAQCAYNRTGILCGACKSGFSLSLGSSRCVSCSHWRTNFPVIVVATLLSGLVLVALLLVLNLTVAVGTLNGVIFYANIVASNTSTFFPFSSPNFVTVFISWLNLDLGIDVCFFEGMDAYWKAWIDLSFPAYLIILVAIVILISEKSTRFAQLVGRKNPVATLATLILLSYTKLLRAVVTSLSFAILDYPDNSQEIVWLQDGTVGYLHGKNVALLIVAIIILLVGVAYTAILFFWQWLLRFQSMNIFRWASDQRLGHFLEPYHAPYVYEHRYWTGLLLLVRVTLYIIAAVNVSNDPSVNLLAIGGIMVGILVLKGSLKKNKIYKRWPLELIEMICYLNLTFVCLISFYSLESRSGTGQTIVGYISGFITFALFVAILLYHIVAEFILKCLKSLRHRQSTAIAQVELDDITDTQEALIAPTSTVVEAPPRGEQPLSAIVEADEAETSQMDMTQL